MTARVEMVIVVTCDHGRPAAPESMLLSSEATQRPCMNTITVSTTRDDAEGDVLGIDHDDLNEILTGKGWSDHEDSDNDASFIVCPQHRECPIVATLAGDTETRYAIITDIFDGEAVWDCPCPSPAPHVPGQGALDVAVLA